MADEHPLESDSIDQTLDDLFAQVRAETPSSPELVQNVLARVRAEQRVRRRVLLVAVIAGALCSALFVQPALQVLGDLLQWLPASLPEISAVPMPLSGPVVLLTGLAALYWFAIEGLTSD